MPKLLIGVLVLIVVVVAVNAVLTQTSTPKLTVLPGGVQNTPGGKGQSGLGTGGQAGGGIAGGGGGAW